MMQQILNIDEISYSSNLNEEGLKSKIEDLFEKRTLGIVGKLTSENEFTVYDKLNVVGWSMPSLKRKAAYLYGKITKGEKGTLVKLTVKPNSILPVFAIASSIIGLVIAYTAMSNTENDNFFIIIGLVFIATGIIYYPISSLLKNRLRHKVVRYLNLNKV